MPSRRRFLKTSSLVSLTPMLPAVLGHTARAAGADKDDTVLVVVQLEGGNDGINTVVPFADDGYGKARKKLRLKEDDLLKLDDHVALNPSMEAAKELFDDGRLSIIQGVGYPNPDRSHFRSMKIWQTASLDAADHTGNGWLGTALDHKLADSKSEGADADAVFIGKDEMPPALWGRRSSAITLAKAEDLQVELASQTQLDDPSVTGGSDLDQFVRRQTSSAFQAAAAFAEQNDRAKSEAKYPNYKLAQNLKLVSAMLRGGNPARVFYTVQNGYDTHADQRFTHANLLREFSRSTKAFLDDLKSTGLDQRVVVLAFSEFGRRVAENDSAGTDHGTAGPVFLAGSPVQAGLVGTAPDMTDLVDGDVKSNIDFRRVYATILQKWLDVPAKKILRGEYQSLNLFG